MLRPIVILSLALLTASCGERPQPFPPAAPTSPLPTAPTPTPPGPTYTLSGTVFESTPGGLRPLAGERMWLWFDGAPGLYSPRAVTTDGSGRYRVDPLPTGTIVTFTNGSEAYRQPCTAVVELTGDKTFDLELIALSSFTLTDLPSVTMRPPHLTGVVYETTSEGRKPIVGADVTAGWGPDAEIIVASTRTDVAGRYRLCGLSGTLYVTGTKAGYQESRRSLDIQSDSLLDIELVPR